MNLANMTRDDLIASLLATRTKLEAAQERIAVLEDRVTNLLTKVLVASPLDRHENDELRDD